MYLEFDSMYPNYPRINIFEAVLMMHVWAAEVIEKERKKRKINKKMK